MNQIENFYQLKQSVLKQYQNSYPYFVGNWKTFGSQDILNLITDIQQKTKQTVSEKWIYTHLKPETNQKIPRLDMLDILSVYVGHSGWNEFVFTENKKIVSNKNQTTKNFKKPSKQKIILFVVAILVPLILVCFWQFSSQNQQKIELKNSFTKDTINKSEVKAFSIEDSVEKPLEIKNGEITVTKNTKVVIKSPFYQDKKITIQPNENQQTVELNPNDYAMMLKAFMKSDIKDWQTRKTQINKILSDDLEVMVMLQNNLGAEYFNKTEFSQKIIIPTAALKQMKIVEIKQDENKKIVFLRIVE